MSVYVISQRNRPQVKYAFSLELRLTIRTWLLHGFHPVAMVGGKEAPGNVSLIKRAPATSPFFTLLLLDHKINDGVIVYYILLQPRTASPSTNTNPTFEAPASGKQSTLSFKGRLGHLGMNVGSAEINKFPLFYYRSSKLKKKVIFCRKCQFSLCVCGR